MTTDRFVRRTPFAATIALLACAVGDGCGGAPLGPEPGADVDRATTNLRLAGAARELALALRDPLLRAGLGAKLAEKPTGDYEVLLRDAWSLPLSDGRTLGELLAATDVGAEPLAHIATPGGVPDWMAGQPVQATWWPAGADAADEIELFDARGDVKVQPAAERPAGATVVVALNERAGMPVAAGDVEAREGALIDCSAGCRTVKLGKVKIYDDHEPWTKGDPEIYMYCTDPGVRLGSYSVYYAKKDLPGVNDTDKWYTYNSTLISNLQLNGGPIQCYLLERDEGLTSPVDSDDSLGSATVYPSEGSKTYYVSDGTFTLY